MQARFVLDHVGLWHHDLAAGLDVLRTDLGLDPEAGGSHPGQGTRNALFGLEGGCYLELIAPDPDQSCRSGLLRRMEPLPAMAPAIVAFRPAVPGSDLHAAACAAGLADGTPVTMQRTGVAENTVSWVIQFLVHPALSHPPFLIDWGGAMSPGERLVPQARIGSLHIATPMPDDLAHGLDRLGLRAMFKATPREGHNVELALDSPVATKSYSQKQRGSNHFG
jgi:Glyoxalase-like domain